MNKNFDAIYWNSLKIRLKQEYPQLTNADLQWRYGTKEDLYWMISLKLGIPRKDLELMIENFKIA